VCVDLIYYIIRFLFLNWYRILPKNINTLWVHSITLFLRLKNTRYHIFLDCFRFHIIKIIFTRNKLVLVTLFVYINETGNSSKRKSYSLIARSAPMYLRDSPLHDFLVSHVRSERCENLLGRSGCRLLARRRVSPPLGRKYWERSATEKARSLKHASLNNAWK